MFFPWRPLERVLGTPRGYQTILDYKWSHKLVAFTVGMSGLGKLVKYLGKIPGRRYFGI